MYKNLRLRRRALAAFAAWPLLPARLQAQTPGPGSTRPPADAPPLKVGFVYVSPVGQAGWTYQHDLGRREMAQALGTRVQTTQVEAVAEGADA
jgi:basic membrane protein A